MKFLNNISKEYDTSIEPPLSFLSMSGDYKSITTQCESPSIKGSYDYKFDKSTTNIQTEGSENSGSSIMKYAGSDTPIEIEEEKSADLAKKSQPDAKHTRYRETKIRAQPETKRPQTRNHNSRAVVRRP
mgnify:FL=1